MRKIKILAINIFAIVLLASCGEYYKALNKGTTEEQYKMAVKKYEKKVIDCFDEQGDDDKRFSECDISKSNLIIS